MRQVPCILGPCSKDLSVLNYVLYWKEKETYTHFECYLYQRCNVCVKESVFEMLNIYIWTHCDTFYCKHTTCVSCVHGKSDRGHASEIHAVCNNGKNWFFTCPCFWTIWYKLKIAECEHHYGTRKLCYIWGLSLCVYWCDCWCCFLLNICCLYIGPSREQSKNLNAHKTLFN